jgi:dGTPase
MVTSLIENSENEIIKMSPKIQSIFEEFHDFMYEAIYLNKIIMKEEEKVKYIIEFLFEYFMKNNSQMPEENLKIIENEGTERAVCDYISGMTDKYVVNLFKQIFIPKPFQI